MSATRESLRTIRKLRLIEGEKEGDAIDFIPAGLYGFTHSPATEGTPLFSKHIFQSFEVHKLADESIHYVGFMTEDDSKALDTSNDAVDLTLYPEPFEKADQLVSVPRSRILKARPVSREHGNFLPLTVTAAR